MIHETSANNENTYKNDDHTNNTDDDNDYNDNNALDTLDRLTKKIRGDFRDKYIIASSINGNEYLASVRDALRNDRKLSTCYYYLYNFNSDEYMNSDVFLLYL